MWHNFAVVVNWSKFTLQVFYSQDGLPLGAVTTVTENSSAGRGPQGQGDFHFGVLKVGSRGFCIATSLSLITPISFL